MYYKKYKLLLDVILSWEDYGPFIDVGPGDLAPLAPPLIRAWTRAVLASTQPPSPRELQKLRFGADLDLI